MGWEQEACLAAAHCAHVWLLQRMRAFGPTPWESLLGSVSFLLHFTRHLSAAAFLSSPSPSHLLHPSAPEGSQHLVWHPGHGAAAMAGCDVSDHCLDPSPLPSGFAAKQRLKTRKQNKSVRKPGICVVSLKAASRSRKLGSGGHFGELDRGCFSCRGLDFIMYFLLCRFASLDVFTTWFLG